MKRAIAVPLLLIAIAVASLTGSVAQAQATTVPLETYIERLRIALTAIDAGDREPRAAIRTALSDLDLPQQISLPDGSSVTVTTSAIIGGAGGPEATTLSWVRARLRVALESADAALATPVPDRSRIDAALADAYGGLQPTSPSLYQRLLTDVRQALGWLLDHTIGKVGRTPTGTVIAWTVVLAFLAGVVLVLRRARHGVVPAARAPRDHRDLPTVDWRRLADEALAAGDLTDAVPALYHVLIGTLDSRGVVRDAPSLTAGECRAAVRRSRPGLTSSIDPATAVFERVVYGRAAADQDDIEILRTAEQAVRG